MEPKRKKSGKSAVFLVGAIKIMDPIGFQKINQENDAAQCPGDGVCPGNRGKLRNELDGCSDIGNPEQTPAGQHGKHGDGCLACATHDTGDTM